MNIAFKNIRLYLKLKDEISCGRYANSPLPPERELALQTGLSRNTLRFALKMLAQEGMLQRTRRKGTFALCTPEKKEPERYLLCEKGKRGKNHIFYRRILSGIFSEAAESGREIDLCAPGDLEAMDLNELKMIFRQRNIKGIIMPALLFTGKEKICQLLETLNLPVILAYCYEHDASVTGYAAITHCLRPAWRTALKYLVESGHKRIITLTLPREHIRDIFSTEEYEVMLKSLGLSPEESPVIRSRVAAGEIRKKLDPFFQDPATRPDAILCYSDNWAPRVYQALHTLHQRVPEDISVMGYGGSINPDFISPELSTVEIGYEEVGHLAVRLLNDSDSWFGSGKAPEIIAPYELKIRNSTRPRR